MPRTASLPSGSYTTPPINQHISNWCGACYLVAAAQSVDDCVFIALTRALKRRPAPRKHLSLQALVDHFQVFQERAEPGWNVCHGGYPLHVLQCIERNECPLLWDTKPKPQTTAWLHITEWFGFARSPPSKANTAIDERVSLTNSTRLFPSKVKEVLRDVGPVVLEISADTVLSVDARTGVVQDLSSREEDHAVSVVGWCRVDGQECYIARNSWGLSRVPKQMPDDESCVDVNVNQCSVDFVPWSGDPGNPGFFFIPTDMPRLSHMHPSPWIGFLVHIAATTNDAPPSGTNVKKGSDSF